MTHGSQPSAAAIRRRKLTRLAFHLHLWLGVIFTGALLVISVTGIALNHKRGLGLMPDVKHSPSAPFEDALPLSELADIGLRVGSITETGGPAPLSFVDRMDVRPKNGYVKVRLRDAAVTEVTVDIVTGKVLHIGPRGDSFLEKVHSGEVFGDGWVLLSDVAAIVLTLTLITGIWLWIAPRMRSGRAEHSGGAL